MVTYHVQFSAEAEKDLADIYHYVAVHDSVLKADALLLRLEKACARLKTSPARGHYPKEMKRIDILIYREINVHDYRIIYQIIARDVVIHAVLDGRRDMVDILARRLTRP